MPTQELGIKENNVKVITVDSLTGEIVNSLSGTDHSPNSDSVDGSVPSDFINPDIKALDSLQAALDNFQNSAVNSDGAIDVSSGFSSDAISSIGDGIVVTATRTQNRGSFIHEVSGSGGTVNVPQVFRVDGNSVQDVSRLLGKRPAGTVSQNSIGNKVIITKHPLTSQPQAVPIQIQTVSLSQASQSSGVVVSLPQGTRTPTKTITISQQGIVSPMKGITMAQVAGSPPKLPISKLPMSPAKTPTKITMIPVSMPGRSPQRIAPAGGQTLLNNSASNVQTTITMSPSKVIKQPGTVHLIQKPIQPSMSNATVVTIPARPGTTMSQGVRQVAIQPGNLQQIHVPGNKFHYIRLANPPNSTQGARTVLQSGTRPGLPATIVAGQTGSQMKITIPAQSVGQIFNPRGTTSMSTVQRIILPATQNQVPIRPSPSAGSAPGTQIIRTTLPAGTGNLTQITGATGGTTFISTGGNTPGVQGYALVPASYLSQIQHQIQVKPATTVTSIIQPMSTVTPTQSQARSDYVPIASSNPALSASQQNKNVNGSAMDSSGGARPRKPCNCTKSQCLKLYCDCFANGEFCHNCNCMNCSNNLEHEEERSRAIKSCLERNPLAFHPKIGKGRSGERNRQHNKGCNCKRSGCLKNYCECYEAKIMCSTSCKCVGCKNFEESPERKTLMHLADAAEVRVNQQTAAKTKLSSQMSDLPSRPVSSNTGERLPFSFVTSEVVEATCACLLAQAEEAERQKMPSVVQERMVIEEFGRCLLQIIESANRTKAPDPDDTS